jgi:hypothetical protein
MYVKHIVYDYICEGPALAQAAAPKDAEDAEV